MPLKSSSSSANTAALKRATWSHGWLALAAIGLLVLLPALAWAGPGVLLGFVQTMRDGVSAAGAAELPHGLRLLGLWQGWLGTGTPASVIAVSSGAWALRL